MSLGQKTTLHWEYRPVDFFENQFHCSDKNYSLTLENGNVVAKLRENYSDDVPAALVKEITDKVVAILSARMILKHEQFTLSELTIHNQDENGNIKKSYKLAVKSSDLRFKGYAPDIRITDKLGNIVSDTKVDREISEDLFISLCANSINKSTLVNKLLESYQSAVADPSDEFIHLYEIQDAISNHFGSREKAQKELPFSKDKWDRLHSLSNNEPIQESRHRGSKIELRPATDEELTEAREIARELIQAFLSIEKDD